MKSIQDIEREGFAVQKGEASHDGVEKLLWVLGVRTDSLELFERVMRSDFE